MNRFGTHDMRRLIEGLRHRALAADDRAAGDLAPLLTDAADSLEAADSYYRSVEGALV